MKQYINHLIIVLAVVTIMVNLYVVVDKLFSSNCQMIELPANSELITVSDDTAVLEYDGQIYIVQVDKLPSRDCSRLPLEP